MANKDIYVTAALKLVRKDEAIIFMQKEYVVENYAPHSKYDKIISGPDFISDGFSSLNNTIFGNSGINGAFGSNEDAGVAYIFSGDQCAKWFNDYAAGHSRILEGPKPIVQMFHFLRGTVFEKGIDAAFESNILGEAFLFKGDTYARINFGTQNCLMECHKIAERWPSFKGSIFQNGFDAALASHIPKEAYLFKGDKYGRIKFKSDDCTIAELEFTAKLEDGFNALGSILPRKNCNLVAN